jgi:hypothetical protein
VQSVETSVSSVELIGDDLLHWVYREGAVVTLREAEEEVARIEQLVKANLLESTRLLIDIRPIRSIDRAASKLFSSDEIHDTYGVQALGLITDSSISKVIGNFYMQVFGPKHPVRLFTDEAAAREWLNSFCD